MGAIPHRLFLRLLYLRYKIYLYMTFIVTHANGGPSDAQKYDVISDTSINVTSDTYVDIDSLDNRSKVYSYIEIINTHATNSLNLTIYGSNDETVTTAPGSNDTSWTALTNANDVTITALNSLVGDLTDRWTWLRFAMKRTTSGQSSSAKIFIKSYTGI